MHVSASELEQIKIKSGIGGGGYIKKLSRIFNFVLTGPT
jgi:hypothetical protein